MPQWMRRYLDSGNLQLHFKRALIVGAIARICSAIFVYGPQALDDYKHGVWPAYQFFAGIPLDIPDYRSHLLVWFLSFFVEIASMFGATSALAQVRAMYLGLGFTSLLGIYGTYLYVRSFQQKTFAALAVYMAALFPLMPFVGTRAFGEAVAMSLVAFGIGAMEGNRREGKNSSVSWLVGFMALALATSFRYHAGLIFLTYGLILLIKKEWRAVIAGFVAGIATLAGQALIDILSGKEAFATLLIYLGENEGGGAKYGVSPWYNPWLFVLGITLAPFSFVFYRSLKNLWREHWPVIVPFLVFVAAHSLVAHKEERFLYPILGLEIWLIAYLWGENAANEWARKIYAPVFLFITALALPIVCFLNTQEGEIEPPAFVQSRYGEVVYLDHQSLFGKSRFQFYFLRPPSELKEIPREELNAHSIDDALASNSKFKAAVLLTSEPEARAQIYALEGIKTGEGQCGQVREAGSLIDKLLYSMNPKHNQRRRPTWYLVCERSQNA